MGADGCVLLIVLIVGTVAAGWLLFWLLQLLLLQETLCQTQPKFKNRCDPATMLSPTAGRQSSQIDATSLDCTGGSPPPICRFQDWRVEVGRTSCGHGPKARVSPSEHPIQSNQNRKPKMGGEFTDQNGIPLGLTHVKFRPLGLRLRSQESHMVHSS